MKKNLWVDRVTYETSSKREYSDIPHILVERRTIKTHSFVGNWIYTLNAILAGDNGFYNTTQYLSYQGIAAGSISRLPYISGNPAVTGLPASYPTGAVSNTKDIDGVNYLAPVFNYVTAVTPPNSSPSQYTYYDNWNQLTFLGTSDIPTLLVGTGTATPTINDYRLTNPLYTLSYSQTEMSLPAFGSQVIKTQIFASVTNNQNSALTITEVGLHALGPLLTPVQSSGKFIPPLSSVPFLNYTYQNDTYRKSFTLFLMTHDLFPSPINFQPGSTITYGYIWEEAV
ncbi:MAG: hypothetical protein QXV17_06885 [Candidatus Micrarchaeaceae archaeon]